MSRASWDQRIARAGELAAQQPSVREVLTFYRELATFQKGIYEALKRAGRMPDSAAVLEPELVRLVSLVERIGPSPLAQAAQELRREGSTLEDLLAAWRETSGGQNAADARKLFFAQALLQPYSEYLASRADLQMGNARATCPFCGEKPQAAVLRAEGDGSKRSLICWLCATEWDFRRVACPACGEERNDQLPVYTANEFQHIRVEACDTCRTYIKSVDLTRNGLAVPVVDELAAIPLNIWAEEHGYVKLQPNLLGI